MVDHATPPRVVLGRPEAQVVDALVRTCPSALVRRGDPVLAAAGPAVVEAVRLLGRHAPLPPGQCLATFAGGLPATWLLHVCVPQWSPRRSLSPVLTDAYRSVLRVAGELGATSLALPLLGATLPFWPLDHALAVAAVELGQVPPDLAVTLVVSSPDLRDRLRGLLPSA